MIYGAVDYKGEKYYTYMKKLFNVIENRQKDYNWLITDINCYPKNPGVETIMDSNYCWLTGDELTKIVQKEDFQWIWAVLSGFEKTVDIVEIFSYDFPYANGNDELWTLPVKIIHPLASVQIVAYDSCGTWILSKEKEIVEKFMQGYPLSEKLEMYIKR